MSVPLKCIWCQRGVEDTTFNKIAHTIPQSLGGKNVCKEVCDDCNHYFGRSTQNAPSIETILKEVFNISRARMIGKENIKKNRAMPRFSSIFFNVNFDRGKIDLKPKFKLQKGFQQSMCRQFKRGLFKIFLEESQRQQNKGFNKTFDFIREFARYNIGDYPVFYFKRSFPVFLGITQWFETPELLMEDRYPMTYLIRDLNFFEFELLTHTFSIPTSPIWNISFDLYKKKSLPLKSQFFSDFYAIEELRNIDLTMSILDDKV